MRVLAQERLASHRAKLIRGSRRTMSVDIGSRPDRTLGTRLLPPPRGIVLESYSARSRLSQQAQTDWRRDREARGCRKQEAWRPTTIGPKKRGDEPYGRSRCIGRQGSAVCSRRHASETRSSLCKRRSPSLWEPACWRQVRYQDLPASQAVTTNCRFCRQRAGSYKTTGCRSAP